MNNREQQDTPEQFRLPGEGTPTWVAMSFTVIGALLAATPAWLWMTEQPRWQEQRFEGSVIQGQATGSAVPACVPAEPLTTPSDSRENVTDEQTTPVSTQLLPEPKDCLLPKPEDCPPSITIPFKRGDKRPVIKDDIQVHIERLREWLNAHPKAKLAVEGHTDSTGPERYNLLLSYQRAKAVATSLQEAGISEKQMTLLAAGENDPLAGIPAFSDDNQRVFLHVNGIESCREVPTEGER